MTEYKRFTIPEVIEILKNSTETQCIGHELKRGESGFDYCSVGLIKKAFQEKYPALCRWKEKDINSASLIWTDDGAETFNEQYKELARKHSGYHVLLDDIVEPESEFMYELSGMPKYRDDEAWNETGFNGFLEDHLISLNDEEHMKFVEVAKELEGLYERSKEG